eukprot:850864-Pelagomonas_calceolata.AAC.5
MLFGFGLVRRQSVKSTCACTPGVVASSSGVKPEGSSSLGGVEQDELHAILGAQDELRASHGAQGELHAEHDVLRASHGADVASQIWCSEWSGAQVELSVSHGRA